LRLEDAASLNQLLVDCSSIDGGTHLPDKDGLRRELASLTDLTADSLAAENEAGKLVAFAWVAINVRLENGVRAFLNGRVHPDYRRQEIGTYLLSWQDARARQIFSLLEDDRPRILRADFYDRAEDALRLYEGHGLTYRFAEDTLQRDLRQPIPANPLPEEMGFIPWSEKTAPEFFMVYDDAFRTRPGFPGWEEPVWRAFFTSYDEFRPDLSLLVRDGDQSAAYALVHVDEEGGWIVQMGTGQAYRRRGLASSLLAELMRRFQEAGLITAWIDVNINNPTARRVYEQNGFTLAKRYTSYQKQL
jgi:GNAT superfamily N-acetyltransferase